MRARRIHSLLLYCLLCSYPAVCIADYYSAITELNRAVKAGKQLASELNVYLELEEARLDRIRHVVKRLSTHGLDPHLSDESEEFFSNPVQAYLTVKRLAVNWQSNLLSFLDGFSNVEHTRHELSEDGATGHDSSSADRQYLAELRARVEQTASMLPDDTDVAGAADALLLLQKTYRLKAEDIANGKLTDGFTCPKLSAAQCMSLGQQAHDSHDILRAEEWFRVALARLQKELHDADERVFPTNHPTETDEDFTIPDEAPPSSIEVLENLAYALGRQGRYAEALNVTQMILREDPQDEQSLSNEAFYRQQIQQGEGNVEPAPPAEHKLTQDYQALCRGEQIFPPPPDSKLYCRYYVPHPYYKIGPVKEEVLFPDPRLVMWYDVIHPSEVQHIQFLATPRLQRATIKNSVTGKLENSYYRISKSAWLPDGLDAVTHTMNQRIHALTGLSMETAEDLQVGNYGIGGYYAPHFDFGRKGENSTFGVKRGNRIATILFYFTDVKAGGATVFNRVGAVVKPVRGSAAFWYNLHPSGEGDLRTLHAACPVLVGSKWVMNVWFHERGQEFRRPCELERGPIESDDEM